ncbi:aminodeoxychorismate synthase component I [Pseudemcibacter aquimaris]|uniref:aminodeoxychorismate synthase component I n=1 Tax=Pseudemcibacter aquimaris TaxID=2857064 RepID=UPI0020111929|nr:aminodeoxychorismate synthase component I [Pseudemcibacter aquimaris]MCC3860378.1 aminodeoxychorismate synthase component I [Pseudemcibacter aquimaris]WDU57704.1 aminodeoxychorismate synthase component I [Pseudemcibacter aquimaris]
MKNQGKFSIRLENNKYGVKGKASYVFDNPIDIITAKTPEELKASLKKIKSLLSDGFYVAGFISYEAGLCFEDKLNALLPSNLKTPLLQMGVFKVPEILNAKDTDDYWKQYDDGFYSLQELSLSKNRDAYKTDFDQIQNYLKSGDIYQVNYTQKADFKFEGNARSFFAALRKAQQVEYGAFIETDDLTVLSLSPELFIRKDGNELTAKPMKGTGPRGRNAEEDIIFKDRLSNSEKDKAENLMIVDLLRNDLSKTAKAGSVNVPKLFEVEKYRTLFTMTSTVKAVVADNVHPVDVMTSVFPCGSVTGAPKIRSQEIIAELEKRERGIYTGAIGYFSPDGDMCFSVPIRTLTIDADGCGELGIGGGIVADSEAEKEYDECLLKASFVTKEHPDFDLIESLKWSPNEGYPFIEQHLTRLQKSADYFSYQINIEQIRQELMEHAEFLSCEDDEYFKVRLLVSSSGNISIESRMMNSCVDTDLIVVLSDERINSNNTLLQHKTTLRDFYQKQLLKYKEKYGCHDVIFQNENGEITEGSYTNIFVKKGEILYTPPVNCGLLGGVYRDYLLKSQQFKCIEKPLYITDIESADEVYVANAVRGLQRVNFQLMMD